MYSRLSWGALEHTPHPLLPEHPSAGSANDCMGVCLCMKHCDNTKLSIEPKLAKID